MGYHGMPKLTTRINWNPSPGDSCFGVHSQEECCERCWKQIRKSNAAEEPMNQERLEEIKGEQGESEFIENDDPGFAEEGAYTYYRAPGPGERMMYIEQWFNTDGNCCCKQGPYPTKKHLSPFANPACYRIDSPEDWLAVSGPTGSKKCEGDAMRRHSVPGVVRPGTNMYNYTRMIPPIFWIPFTPILVFPLGWDGFFVNECFGRCMSTPGCHGFNWNMIPKVNPMPYLQIPNHQTAEILRFVPIRMGWCTLKGWSAKEQPDDGKPAPAGWNYQTWRRTQGVPDNWSVGVDFGFPNLACGDETPSVCELNPDGAAGAFAMLPDFIKKFFPHWFPVQCPQSEKAKEASAKGPMGALAAAAAAPLLLLLARLKGPGGAGELINYTAGVKSELLDEKVKRREGDFCKWWSSQPNWHRHGLDRQIFKLDEKSEAYVPTYQPLPYNMMLSAQENRLVQKKYCERELNGCFDDLYEQHTTQNPTWSSVRDVYRAANFRTEATAPKDPGFYGNIRATGVNPDNTAKQAEESMGLLRQTLKSTVGRFLPFASTFFGKDTSSGDVASGTSVYMTKLNATATHPSPACLALPIAKGKVLSTNPKKPFSRYKDLHFGIPEVREVDVGKPPRVRMEATTLAKTLKEFKAEGLEYQKWMAGKSVKGWRVKRVLKKEVQELETVYDPSVGWSAAPKNFLEDASAARKYQKKEVRADIIKKKKRRRGKKPTVDVSGNRGTWGRET